MAISLLKTLFPCCVSKNDCVLFFKVHIVLVECISSWVSGGCAGLSPRKQSDLPGDDVQVSGIVEQIVKFGKVTRPVLGISFAPDQSVEQLGVSGVLVLDAPASGPAGKAVITQSDYISFILYCSRRYHFHWCINCSRTHINTCELKL
jgi:hypothetical protein